MKIRDALEYYADPRVYQEGIMTPDSGVPYTVRAVLLDGGQEAREALAALDDQEAMKAAFQEAADQASAENRLSYRKDPAVWINGFAAAWQAAHRRLGVKDA